MTAFMIRNTRI